MLLGRCRAAPTRAPRGLWEPTSAGRCKRVVRRVTITVLAAMSVFTWTAVAEAKELSSFRACGASGCKAIKDPRLLRGLIRAVEAQGEPVSVPTPAPAPFLRLDFWVRGDGAAGPSFVQYYAPSRGLVALNTDPGAWTWVRPGALVPLLDRVTTGVTPFPKPRIMRVTIGGRVVRDPASYARLFMLQGEAGDLPDEPDWKPIVIETAGPTPWSTSAATLEYSATKNVLWRSSQFVNVPSQLAAQLEARKSLAGSPSRSVPWVLLLGGLGGVALVVPTTILFRRRRPA